MVTIGIAMGCAPAKAYNSGHGHTKVRAVHHGHYHKVDRGALKGGELAGRLNHVVGPLASKVRQIQSACGSVVISSVRHTRVPRSRHMSLHASGRAVDLRGKPRCIYTQLRDWTRQGGGYSTDYGSVQHVHISYGGREAGLAFRHHGAGRTRYASRHRYAFARKV
jgi:hypothetical protein